MRKPSYHHSQMSAADLEAIERVCDAFESAWRATADAAVEGPELAEFAERFSETYRMIGLTELVILDAAYRSKCRVHPYGTRTTNTTETNEDRTGVNLTWADYVARFPELHEVPPPPELEEARLQRRLIANRFEVIGHYASGGLGRVNVARDTQVGRQVAVKEMHDRIVEREEYRQRFLREAEITGRLEHPCIVPVYALGRDDQGRPYYAMRLIQGKSLLDTIDALPADNHTEWTRGEVRNLVGRFLDVCQAVDYAHSQGVIHRDIKPDNIVLGDFGETFLVDWGLAKRIDQDDSQAETLVTGAGTHTRYGVAMGTPAYMSPEQAAGEWHRVDQRTDIYSLGATLWQLITRQLPQRQAASAVDQAIANIEPSLRPLLAISGRAIQVDPDDRYESVRALIHDIELSLAERPVSVYRDPWRTRARRLFHRHQIATASSVVAVCLICIGLGFYSWIAGRHADATARTAAQLKLKNMQLDESLDREKALRLVAERSEKQATDAMNSIFKSIRLADPNVNARDVGVVDALEGYVREFEDREDVDPKIRALVMLELAATYYNLALYEESRSFARRAYDMFVVQFGEYDKRTLAAAVDLARALERLGDAKAHEVITNALDIAQEQYAQSDALRLRVERTAAVIDWKQGEPRRAQAALEGLVTRYRALHGEDSEEYLSVLADLANVHAACGEVEEAVLVAKGVYERRKLDQGDSVLVTIKAGSNYAAHLLAAGKTTAAIKELEGLLARSRGSLGDEHYFSLILMNRLGTAYLKRDLPQVGIPLIEESLERSQQIYGVDHPRTLVSANSLASIYFRQGDYPKAIEHFAGVYEDSVATRGLDHPETLTVGNNLATAYGLNEQYDHALEVYQPTLDAQTRKLGRHHRNTIRTLFNMALILQKAARTEESMPYCIEAAELASQHLGGDHPYTQTSLSVVGMGYLALGEYERAKAALQDCYDSRVRTLPDHWLRFHTMSVLGETYFRCGNVESAKKLLHEAYEGMLEREEKLGAQGIAYFAQAKQRLELVTQTATTSHAQR